MTVRPSEYDRFGPWVEQVLTEQDVPRLFAGHSLDLDAARLVLKVPRNIARRDATAHMALYDQLLVLGTDRFTVLRRRSGPGDELLAGFDEHECAYTDVVAVLDEVDLLDGRLRVLTRDGRTLTVDYNGAANALPRRLAEELRVLTIAARAERAPWAGGAGGAPRPFADTPDAGGVPMLAQSALGNDDIGVVNAHRAVAAHRPELRVLAWHGRQRLSPRPGGTAGVARRLAHALKPATLHAGILAADRDTLELFGRRATPVRGRTGEYALSRWVLPRAGLDRVETRPHPTYTDATTVTFAAGAARWSTVVPTGSEVLRLLTGPR